MSNCAFCGKRVTVSANMDFYDNNHLENGTMISEKILEETFICCEECLSYYNSFGINYFFYSADDKFQQFKDKYKSKLEQAVLLKREIDNLLVTSSPSFEGYHIVEYKGYISTDTIFENSLKDMLVKGIGDSWKNMFNIKSRIATGPMELIENGKKYALEEFYKKVIEKGGNAVIAMDIDDTVGDMIVLIRIKGTAVVIEKNEETHI